MANKLLVDIGGTKLRAGLFDGTQFLSTTAFATNEMSLEDRFRSLISEHKSEIDFVGVSFAGQVSDGVILSAPNVELGSFAGLDFVKWTEENFAIRSAIDNDLLCAALAEAKFHKESRSLAVLYIGTGFGGAFVDRDHLIRGYKNLAGEIGHIPFETTPFVCGCGASDCLELSCSGNAISLWREHLSIKESDIDMIFASSDQHSIELASRFERALTHAVKTSVALFNPDTIVLGGGVAKNSTKVLQIAQDAALHSFKPASSAKVLVSLLDDSANMLGASELGLL